MERAGRFAAGRRSRMSKAFGPKAAGPVAFLRFPTAGSKAGLPIKLLGTCMRYELSERVRTNTSAQDVRDLVERQFGLIATDLTTESGAVKASNIQATFGSVQRKASATVFWKPVEDGYLLVADVSYAPSVYLWLFIVVGLFSYILPVLLPIGFYFYHQGLVKTAVQDALKRIETELHQVVVAQPTGLSVADELGKLVKLRDDGALTTAEFEQQKRSLLR